MRNELLVFVAAILAAAACGDSSSKHESRSGPRRDAGQSDTNVAEDGSATTSSDGRPGAGGAEEAGRSETSGAPSAGGALDGSGGRATGGVFMTDAGDEAGGEVSEPCEGVPAGGECLPENRVRRCIVTTGNALPRLLIKPCGATRSCSVVNGRAECLPLPGVCTPGDQECTSEATLRACDANGQWQAAPCEGVCHPSALGAFCSDAATESYSGNLYYEVRGPDQQYADWESVRYQAPAVGLLVVSSRNGELVDAALTDTSGHYSIRLPTPWQEDDELAYLLVSPNQARTGIAFAVAEPDVPSGIADELSTPGPAAQHWFWTVDPEATPSGSDVVITEELGSGAVRVFDYLGYAYDFARAQYGLEAPSLIVWLRMNTGWSCGACFIPAPTVFDTFQFDAQIVLPATAEDESYWADPVTAHELGHWVMWAYSAIPLEGGPHCLGVPTFPGQAWSEGWATAFSSILRESSIYYDKQEGTMFWFDLEAHRYPDGTPWARPLASSGLLQKTDENEIAALVWELGDSADIGTVSVFSALASPRMTRAPFARGYTRRTWKTTLAEQCAPQSVVDTGESVPMFADFLDALRCGGAPPGAIDAVTQPAIYYPYSSADPLCE